MSFALIDKVNKEQMKHAVVDVRSGDTVKVHQKIREGSKERIQIFEGVVIRTDNKQSHTSRITVRKIASGIGVEKSFLLHSPLVVRVEVTRRSKVRRNFLSYLRELSGKKARLKALKFDREAINTLPENPTSDENPDQPKDQSDNQKPEGEAVADAAAKTGDSGLEKSK